MIIGKSPFTHEPTWRLNDCILNNVNKLEILGNVFNQYGNSSDHVNNRIAKSRQTFYGLSSAGITYPGASPDVQACLYKCICQSTLTYGLECMPNSAVQMRRLESVQGKLIKQSLGLNKRSHNTNILRALNINKVQDIVNRNVLSLYTRIFKVESPARRLMIHFLTRYIVHGVAVPGTLIQRVVDIGISHIC